MSETVSTTHLPNVYCKSRNFNGHFNLTNITNEKKHYKKAVRFAHAHLRTIIARARRL